MNKKTDNKFSEIKPRIIQVLEYKDIPKEDFYVKIGMTSASFRGRAKYTPLNSSAIENVLSEIPDLDPLWLLTGKGKMFDADKQPITERKEEIEETRPRIPFNAAAGTLSIALDGITNEYAEQMPVIKAFARYDFTILAKGDSMLPEFHSGDELACLYVKQSSFIQWGRFHVLDTSQGVIVKRIFDVDDEYIRCTSENSDLYRDFQIHKSEIYNLALVIGLVRRY
ncbi:MAG TPA: S24 family peptidase [Dysgonomonas sp.]|uniref:S24 family peptidase n=1 Tax=unclassified Dysgonomonas TaxID=2630389 RepID=UPI0025B91907|nr:MULTISPECIES: S24 family peptidase [unclassified Dysgonomonas]HML64679.1 S24 family peptidase [Dysgonomonas sp.]